MRPEELCINDWVTCKKWRENPFKLTRINDSGKYFYGVTFESSKVGPFLIEELEPIPLTPEILEKNGFVYNAIPFVDGWEQFGLTLHRGGNGYRINCGINVSLIIDYVHELQHALRLCGIKKEIEL